MAVFKHAYRPYEGPLTPAWSRFLVIPRYAFEELRRKRFYSIFFLVSLIRPSFMRSSFTSSTTPAH